MSSQVSTLLLCIDGVLTVAESFMPSYVGGRNRLLEISPRASFGQLQSRILRVFNIDATRNSINLICRYPFGAAYVATPITDDEVTESILRKARTEPLVIYVEVQAFQSADVVACNSPHRPITGGCTDNLLISSQENVTQLTDIHQNLRCPPYSGVYQGSSSRGAPNPESRYEDVLHHTDEGYQTMDSASSDSNSDDDLDCRPNSSVNIDHNEVMGLEFIRRHSMQNTDILESMLVNNEYVATCQTVEEWDRNATFDGPSDTTSQAQEGM